MSDNEDQEHKLKFSEEELANIVEQILPGPDQKLKLTAVEYNVTINKERKVTRSPTENLTDTLRRAITIDPNHPVSTEAKKFTSITGEKINLEDSIKKLANKSHAQVMNTMKEVLDYITGVYSKYKNDRGIKKQFEGKESSYHGFLAGFLMNFKYRYHLKLYLELFAGKGQADIILLVRGIDKSSSAIPIIIKLKAGTDVKSTSQKAMKQVQDYVKGFFSNFVRMITTASEVVCVGLNFEMNNPKHAKYSFFAERFLNRKGNSVIEKLLDNSNKDDATTAALIRKQLEYLYYGIVWSNGGGSNLHYMSKFVFGQLLLIPDITEEGEELSKCIYIYNQGDKMITGTTTRPKTAEEKIRDCVTTIVLTIGEEVFILHINEAGNISIQMPENKMLNIDELNGMKKVYRVNCNLYGTPSNKNPFDKYCKENTGVAVKTYNSLDEYQGNGEILQGNFSLIDKNEKFKAAMKKALESGKYNDYKEVFKEISRILYPFKSLINNEAEFQAVLHGLFSSYSDDNIKVITEFQIGGGEKLDIMLIIQAIDKTTEHPPVGIELKFAKKKELNNKVKEADDQLERYKKKGKAYKVVTDADKFGLMYAVFDADAADEDSLIKVGGEPQKEEFVEVIAKHSSDTMLPGQQPTGNVQQPAAQRAGHSQAVSRN